MIMLQRRNVHVEDLLDMIREIDLLHPDPSIRLARDLRRIDNQMAYSNG